jgi:hypothetical protein
MTVAHALALLAALALAGCVSTHDEPFPLDDGVAIAPAAKGYVCDTFDPRGRRQVAAKEARLIALRRDQKTQYAFIDAEKMSAEPFTLHKGVGALDIAAVAHADAPGEDLYLVEIADAGKAFRLYAESGDFPSRAQGLAQDHGVTLTHNPLTNDLAGPLSGQKAFMIDMAAKPAAWTVAAECRARK